MPIPEPAADHTPERPAAAPSVRYSHTGCCVTDLERSRRFYVEALGFTEVLAFDVTGPEAARLMGLAEPVRLRALYLRRDGFVLELLGFSEPPPEPPSTWSILRPGLTHVSLMVDDLDAACARVTACGGRVRDAGRVAGAVFVEDPDGQVVELLAPGSPLFDALHPGG